MDSSALVTISLAVPTALTILGSCICCVVYLCIFRAHTCYFVHHKKLAESMEEAERIVQTYVRGQASTMGSIDNDEVYRLVFCTYFAHQDLREIMASRKVNFAQAYELLKVKKENNYGLRSYPVSREKRFQRSMKFEARRFYRPDMRRYHGSGRLAADSPTRIARWRKHWHSPASEQRHMQPEKLMKTDEVQTPLLTNLAP